MVFVTNNTLLPAVPTYITLIYSFQSIDNNLTTTVVEVIEMKTQ